MKDYKLNNYRKKPAFAGFLPGISGVFGIPIWCYYTNRGQCISCFGTEDKDHSIMEFLTAQQAYELTARRGFRTFIKVNGEYSEAFTNDNFEHDMLIGQNVLSIEEENTVDNIMTKVSYFTLPDERVGGLVRILQVTNNSNKKINLEILDGCPEIVPYGVNLDSLKNMTQTAKAWMQVEDVEDNRAFFRVRASMADSAEVTEIQSGNFSIAVTENGTRLKPVVDFTKIFDYDTAFGVPHGFIRNGVNITENQMTMNQIPCSFYGVEKVVKPYESVKIYQVIGQASTKAAYEEYAKKDLNQEYFEDKLNVARSLTEEITSAMETKTGNEIFDEYCRQDFLDNVLRGGMPIELGNRTLYIFNRKHGDMERDYNYFKLLPEFFSQGNGNFRDVNQNRRCDTFFFPNIREQNIKLFYDLIQLDGYNHLSVEKTAFIVKEDELEKMAEILGVESKSLAFMLEPFTPGRVAEFLFTNKPEITNDLIEELVGKVISIADMLSTSTYGEGYWCDHWTYNLDLVEELLSIHPELEHELLFEDKSYIYKKPEACVLPRKKRYVKDKDVVYQYNFLEHVKLNGSNIVCDENNNEIKTTLIEKLILLDLVKFATLDPYGCGVEMEGGKPGWYDALNGLPGLFGSSMAETCELARNIQFTLNVLQSGETVELLSEINEFMENIKKAIENKDILPGESFFNTWNELNTAKEEYRKKIYAGVSGKTVNVKADDIISLLTLIKGIVDAGIKKAIECGDGLIPTYFTYEADDVCPTSFKQHTLPHFLEGPVRYLKLNLSESERRNTYNAVKASKLYDNKLKMYKVNEPIVNESFKLGRCRAFTPGWLENESIWLHMEYKYLLELLKSNLYQEFIADFKNAAVPFIPEEMYGRSPYENSSFLVSSANPDEKIHGRGFVARLSGSTVEFMDMWKRMMFGSNPYKVDLCGLILEFAPVLPKYLLGKEGTVEVTFMGKIKVCYHVKDKSKDYYPGNYSVAEYALSAGKAPVTHIYADHLEGQLAKDVRDYKYSKIDVYLE